MNDVLSALNINVGDKALLTCNSHFFGADGRQYRAVFGTICSVRSDAETLGVKTNRGSTNWYIEIGALTLAGCQVFYALRCDQVERGDVPTWAVGDDGLVRTSVKPNEIYDADAALAAVAK